MKNICGVLLLTLSLVLVLLCNSAAAKLSGEAIYTCYVKQNQHWIKAGEISIIDRTRPPLSDLAKECNEVFSICENSCFACSTIMTNPGSND